MGFFNDLTHLGALGLGKSYDYLTPGRGSSRVTDWAFGNPEKHYATSRTSHSPYPSSPQPDPNEWMKKWQEQQDASNARIRELQAQLAAQPKLPYYNTSQAWATAQKQAEKNISPVYVDKLNAYLKKEHAGISQQRAQNKLDKETIAQSLADALAGIDISENAAQENQANSLADVATNETNYQTDEGTQFDRARANLLSQIASSGLTTSGLGRQQESQAIDQRNQASKEQEQAFASKRRDINALANQTLASLSNRETSVHHTAEGKNKQSDKDLRDYIENAQLEENKFRTMNESQRQAAIAGAVTNYYDRNLARFIQGLIDSGARSQDVALAQRVYG